jgi:hypothetical protein
MIKNLFRPCCEKCCFIDARVETESSESILDTCNGTITTLYCTHMLVCGEYYKNGRDTPIGE